MLAMSAGRYAVTKRPMRITAPEYLILLGIGVLNIWGALILASVRARAKEELPAAAPAPPIDHSRMDGIPRSVTIES
jgi:uncharacterized membrane protein